MGVFNVVEMGADIVSQQINCLYDDIDIHAVKIGMVSSIDIIRVIEGCLIANNASKIVVDPVMVSKSGCHLLRPEATTEFVKRLFPLAEIVTPNLFEAEVITGDKINNVAEMEDAAKKIHALGASNVVVKGGHLIGDAVDVLYDGEKFYYFKSKRINTKNTHGTGCTFSSAIAVHLARGYTLPEAVEKAKLYIYEAIENALEIGHGVGPTNHFFNLYMKAGVPID
jgi:hydroxymethylpyrimidine/phosphomethylpyrimidine kinase